MSWQDHAIKLWGDEYIAPMSDVLGINRRTIERWRAGEGEPREAIQIEMRRLASRVHARAIGTVLRRLSQGEHLEDIQADYRRHVTASILVRHELGKYHTIAVLAARSEPDEAAD